MKPFHYLEELDAFVVTPEFERITHDLGLSEWHAAVWIGRLLAMDNDYGEHVFDNWHEREAKEEKASSHGIESNALMIVVPERFADGKDGPCSSPEMRKAFWTDVLCSLDLSTETVFTQARLCNERARLRGSDDYLPDLAERIERYRAV